MSSPAPLELPHVRLGAGPPLVVLTGLELENTTRDMAADRRRARDRREHDEPSVPRGPQGPREFGLDQVRHPNGVLIAAVWRDGLDGRSFGNGDAPSRTVDPARREP
jgi:hypothetical protein